MTLDNQSINVVIGIDFGTSRSGYAYAFTGDTKIFGKNDWSGAPAPCPKTLTHLLYSPDDKVEAWGFNAKKRLAQLRRDKAADKYNFFQNFKMQLREGGERTANGPVLTTNNGKKFAVIDLITDYLTQLKDLALKEIKAATSGILHENEIRWCLTIPAIWTDADKQLMRYAAQKAELIGYSEAEAERLLLVLEPEAAAIYLQEREKLQLEPGTRFMVVDCGGGTVDITAHEVLPGKGLQEVAEGTGGAYGSMYVDRSFQDYLEKKLTAEVIERFHDEEPVDYLEMMADWERTKCDFDPEKSGDIYFPIRPKLFKKLDKDYPNVLKSLSDEQDGEDSYILLDRKKMNAIFIPTLNGLVQKVEEEFAKLGSRGCDLIYLVGGFSKSPVLREKIQEKFSKKVHKIVMPSEPGEAIVQGSVFCGLNPEIIRTRCSRLTYGCKSRALFNPEKDPKNKKFYSMDVNGGGWYCKDRFSIFVLAGDSVGVNKIVTHKFLPTQQNQTKFQLEFYATKKREVRYVDEDGVEKIGDLNLEIQDITGGFNREVEVTMYFGKTEIQVEAKDKTSGKKYDTTLRFSSTYSPEILGV
ncbi:chaperone protein [Scytonema hofmannii PCC 7110]|uniref:Chaperone protein n=1 Tax=Scytonema hofmannii PCC 7110 TaxID=128403 RepID=A0A139X070_9CYAN|nr:Hsp70 family protein [Scytonema hofmannii]KYC38101.1 chaperone protein [Scytonema hofmannii PCC 7110]